MTEKRSIAVKTRAAVDAHRAVQQLIDTLKSDRESLGDVLHVIMMQESYRKLGFTNFADYAEAELGLTLKEACDLIATAHIANGGAPPRGTRLPPAMQRYMALLKRLVGLPA